MSATDKIYVLTATKGTYYNETKPIAGFTRLAEAEGIKALIDQCEPRVDVTIVEVQLVTASRMEVTP